ncbi:NIN-like protein [Tanacetum coccineum]
MPNVVSDTRKVIVKATFKDDMIKVQIPISSRLFELKNEVAHRTKLKSAGFRIKYKDEDDDLILLACDADLQNLLGGSRRSLKDILVSWDEYQVCRRNTLWFQGESEVAILSSFEEEQVELKLLSEV